MNPFVPFACLALLFTTTLGAQQLIPATNASATWTSWWSAWKSWSGRNDLRRITSGHRPIDRGTHHTRKWQLAALLDQQGYRTVYRRAWMNVAK